MNNVMKHIPIPGVSCEYCSPLGVVLFPNCYHSLPDVLYGIGIALAPQAKRRFHNLHTRGEQNTVTRVNLHFFFALMENDGMFSRLIDPAHN